MVKKAFNIITSILVAILVIIATSLAFAKVLGAGAYTVLSGSMEPVYHVGSLIYVKNVDVEDLKAGDPITFAMSEELVATHRIVDVIETEDGTAFVTKGDANDTNDANPVNYRNVIGKPVFSVPYLGYAISFVRRPPGLFIAVAAVAIILLINIIKSQFGRE